MSKLCLRVPSFPGKDKLAAKGAVVAAKVSQKSPEICVAGAIILGVTGTVLACRATLKVDTVLDSYKEKMEKIHQGEELQASGSLEEGHEYPVEKARQDKFVTVLQTGVDLFRLYLPSLVCGTMAIALVLKSYQIMMQRQATLLIAYEGLQKAYDAYRDRVREEIGVEREEDIYKGVKRVETVDEKGKKKKGYEIGKPMSPYTVCFCEISPMWQKDAELNKFFLKLQESHANDMLKIRGHIFLNEVLDMLGLPRSPMGQDVGWLKNGQGDGKVYFGLWDPSRAETRMFINGDERSVWLDFNCDGFIKDKI